MSNRLQNTTRNSIYNCINMFSQIILGFVARSVFIYTLDKAYLGVSGLFGNILGILSFSELGIGTAIGFSLYKPLAENDIEKIKSLMALFKKAYCAIGFTVLGIGCMLIPWLPYLTKNESGLSHIAFYYLIFLFDSAIGYFFSYRTTLLSCDQKAFRLTKINTISRYVITLLQILVLVTLHNYTLYLLIDIGIRLLVQFYCMYIVKKQYPYLNDKNIKPLPKEEKQNLIKNVRALMIHSLGYISITQTDNIIISSFIGLETVGIVSNYALITTYLSNFINTLLNGAVASFGNLIAKENKEVQLSVYQKFRFLSHWLNGWMATGFLVLSTRLVTLMFGADYALPWPAVLFMAMVVVIRGELNPMMSFREAAGMFNRDKYLALCESVINLVVSIIAVQKLGIVGVYLGTVTSALFTIVVRWYVLYPVMFPEKSNTLFSGTAKYLIGICASCGVCYTASHTVFFAATWGNFIGMLTLCVLVPNVIYWLLNRNSEEMRYYLMLSKKAITAIRAKLRLGSRS
ncbi:MAG: hypothetical protein RSD62_02915 [Ruthenibacterium sp.]